MTEYLNSPRWAEFVQDDLDNIQKHDAILALIFENTTQLWHPTGDGRSILYEEASLCSSARSQSIPTGTLVAQEAKCESLCLASKFEEFIKSKKGLYVIFE